MYFVAELSQKDYLFKSTIGSGRVDYRLWSNRLRVFDMIQWTLDCGRMDVGLWSSRPEPTPPSVAVSRGLFLITSVCHYVLSVSTL